MAKDLLK
ncbi:Protein of unknown function [Lactobacillus delbrueckii subsp. bulgaricus]|nr:Protein of unknown function [Lactobacillus delbrueckii subsp. bulgaricus]CDR74189.1 Protein of unknown function [Lactobacillus delbrueckii subsp. bulgaricus]